MQCRNTYKKIQKKIKSWQSVNKRIITLNLTLYGRNIIILAVYGPNDDSSASEKDYFINKLQDEITKM